MLIKTCSDKVAIDRAGKKMEVYPHEVKAGDRICDSFFLPLRDRKRRRAQKGTRTYMLLREPFVPPS